MSNQISVPLDLYSIRVLNILVTNRIDEVAGVIRTQDYSALGERAEITKQSDVQYLADLRSIKQTLEQNDGRN